ncbi:MAG: magnesium transporter MgtE [Acidobacteriota bacterium]
METTGDRRQEVLAETLAKFLARGAQANVSKLLGRIRPEDVAALIERFAPEQRLEIFQVLISDFPDAAGDVLTMMEPARRLALLEQLAPEQVAGLLERIPVDDAVFVLESLPPALHDRMVELVDLRDLSDVQTQLAYPERSAGRLMDTGLFALPETETVRDAIAAIQTKRDVEMIFYLYVVDRDGHLVGVTSLRQLLLTRPEAVLSELMQRSVIKVHVDTDQEEVARQASRYDLLAVPVVDDQNHLVGIVTVDDIIDVVQEEAADDLLRMAGTSENERLYEDRPLSVARLRLPSLLATLAGLLLTGVLLERFQTRFADALFLLAFVPAVMGLSGTIGGQTSAVAVRGLASGRLGPSLAAIGAFVLRQLRVGLVLGVACGALAGIAAVALQRNLWLGGVVGLAIALAVLLASLLGALVPPLLDRIGLDPAVASGPLLGALHDIAGILIYFGLASALLRHLAS